MKQKKTAVRSAAGSRERELLRQVRALESQLARASHLASFPGDNPMPVCELGANGRITYMNAALRREFPGLTGRSTAHPWIAGIKADVLPLLASGKNKVVHREIAIGGRWYDQAIHYVRSERRVRIYGRDITKRKQAEQGLGESNEELIRTNRELGASEQQLRAANEELTATNQELQASDEEIKSANDKLVASEEELKAANLELTVADENLREASARTRDILKSMTDAYFACDEQWRLTSVNPHAAKHIFHRPASELTGRSLWDLSPLDAKDGLSGKLRQCATDRCNARIEWQHPATGSWYEVHLNPRPGRVDVNLLDITDRKSMEQQLRFQADILQCVADAVIVTDLAHKITSWNKPAEKIYGWAAEEAVGRFIREIVQTQTDGKKLDNIYRTVAGGRPVISEHIQKTKDGRLIHVECNSMPLTDPGGKNIGYVTVNRDITERKRAEQALIQGDERLRFALETSHTGAWDLDLVDHTAVRSLEHDRIFGYQELLPQWTYEMFIDHVAPQDKADVDAAFKRAIETRGTWNFECRIRRTDGEIRWIWAAGRHVPDSTGTPRRMAGIVQDITERKLAEQAVQREKDRLASLIASITDEVWFADVNGTFALANPSAVKEFGLGSADGTKVQDLAGNLEVLRADRSPRPVDEAPPLRALNGEVIQRQEEIIRTPGSGQLRYREVSAAPVHDANGGIIGSVSVVRDITDRKLQEEELKRLNRTLTALSRSSQAMMHAQSEQSYLDEVCNFMIEDCRHAMVWIGYAEQDEAKTVRPVSHCGFEDGYLDTLHITWDDSARGRGPTGTAIRTGKPSLCCNMLTDPAFAPWRAEAVKRGYASSVVLPLLSGDTAFGAISIYSKDPDPFSEDEVKLLTELASDLSYGIGVIRQREARDQAEQDLYKSEERFRAIATASPVGIGVVSSPGAVYQFVNAAYEQAFGYQPGELLGKTTPQIYADVADRDRLLQELKQTGSVANFEIRMKRKDGSVFWSLSSVQPITYGGQPAMLGAFVDITERKRLEREISSLAKFPSENPNPVMRVKNNGELLYANEKSAPLLRSWHAAVGGKIPGKLSEIAAAASKEGVVKAVESESDNRIYSLEFIPVSAAGYLNLYGRDITERKLAENALERERANLRTIFDSVNTGLLLVDAQGVVTRANSTAVGWASKDITSSGRAQPGDLLGCAHARDSAGGCGTADACGACPIRNAFQTALQTGQPVKDAEAEVQFGAGGSKGRAWFEVNADPVTMEGRPHVIISLNNITERKQAEQILEQQQQELQAANQELSAKNQELLASEEELRASNDAIIASEAALRDSEMRYRRLFEAAQDGILILDAGTGVIESANPFIEDLLDYPREELVGKELWQIGLFQDIVASRESFLELQRKEFIRYEDLPLQTKAGRRKEVEFVSNVYPVGDRKVVQCNIRDITERKLAELALRENEEKYRALFDNMIDGVALHRVLYDDAGRAVDYIIEDVNSAFEKLTGLDAKTAVGQKASQLYGTGAPPYLDIYARVAASGNSERFDTEFIPMGKCFSIAVFSPARGYFTTVFEDITERKTFDQALKESENRFRAIFEQAAVGVALLNTETGQYVRINHQYCSFLGYTMKEMLQRTFQEVTFEPDVQANVDYNAQLRNGTLNSATFEKRYVRKDGGVVWGSVTISPLWKQGDTPRTYLHITIVEDITERKRFEEELRQSREQLEQRVNERTAELLKANHQLEMTRRLSDIGTLASTVAHELRNPLAAIRMATYNIRRKAKMPELDKHLANIDAKVTDSDQIINNLLFYSRIRKIEYQPVDISALLDESLETVAGRHQHKHAACLKEYGGLAGLVIDADRLLVKEVFDNLLDNALDAVPDQGGRVVISGDVSDPALCVIRVSDNGSGIDPALLQKVFEPFFSTKSKGTGLGLAVCRQIVELHQGQIAIESAPGQGTTITVSLPRKKAAA